MSEFFFFFFFFFWFFFVFVKTNMYESYKLFASLYISFVT